MNWDLFFKTVLFLFAIGVALPWSMGLCTKAITDAKLKSYRDHLKMLKQMEDDHGEKE